MAEEVVERVGGSGPRFRARLALRGCPQETCSCFFLRFKFIVAEAPPAASAVAPHDVDDAVGKISQVRLMSQHPCFTSDDGSLSEGGCSAATCATSRSQRRLLHV